MGWPRRSDRGLTVSLTNHAARRIRQRHIPPEAVWDAIAHPFVRIALPGGRQIGAIPAAVGGRWAWVEVVILPLGERRYRVLTVYPRTPRAASGDRGRGGRRERLRPRVRA